MGFEVQQVKGRNIDLSKIASSASNAKSGNFVKVSESVFSSPGLEFKDRGDGTVAIINNGTVIGFTVLDDMGNSDVVPEEAPIQSGNVDVKPMVEDTKPAEEPAPTPEAHEEKIEVLEEETPAPSAPEAPAPEAQPEVIEEIKEEVQPEVPAQPEPEVPPITIETTGTSSGRGGAIDVPTQGQNGLTRDYTNYDYFFNKWTGGTRQRQMADLWDASGRQEDAAKGIAMYNGRYIIAMTETFGQVGDEVDIVLENGTVVPCVLGDIKSMSDPNCNQYGHNLGGLTSCVEWETTRSMDDAAVLGDWRKQKVVQVINTGTTVI